MFEKTRSLVFLPFWDVMLVGPSDLIGGRQDEISYARTLDEESAVEMLDELMSHLDGGVRSPLKRFFLKLYVALKASPIVLAMLKLLQMLF